MPKLSNQDKPVAPAKPLLERQDRLKRLCDVLDKWDKCKKCRLHATANDYVHLRFGFSYEPQVEVEYKGQRPAILFIGEAPGDTEDLLGVPFVGPAGKILNGIIRDVDTGLHRVLYFAIANTIACAPWDTVDHDPSERKIRQPSKEEMRTCSPRLQLFISILQPRSIVLLGKVAEGWFKSVGLAVGRCSNPSGIDGYDPNTPVLALQHPAYILRQGGKGSVDYKRACVYLSNFLQTNQIP